MIRAFSSSSKRKFSLCGVLGEAMGGALVVVLGLHLWVQRPDGSRQCDESGSVHSLKQGAAELSKAGVSVLKFKKSSDGKVRIQMCGAPTGKTHAYRIKRESLEKALTLGFVEVKEAKSPKAQSQSQSK